jgi:antirestriction protein ArdC
MSNTLYANVAQRILTEFENGAAPWVKPWSATAGHNVPMNASTGKPYNGVNVILLWMAAHAYKAPLFLTYKQAEGLGGHVRRGQHGVQICKVVQGIAKGKTDSDDDRAFTTIKFYTVFNVEQCEGLPANIGDVEPAAPRHNDQRDATIDEFIQATGAAYSENGGDRAFYRPSTDSVHMPLFASFNAASSYYATAFHELGHWTGHTSRLDRDGGKKFGDVKYAFEELIAELTAAFLCAEFSIDGELRHAGYIGNWIALLKDNPRAFFSAASAAQKAADYLRGKALAEPLPIAA